LYKQINAPFGVVGLAGIDVSTAALRGDDATYAELEGALADLTSVRDAVAAQMRAFLNGATFPGRHPGHGFQVGRLIHMGLDVVRRARELVAQAGSA
jgi:hypothetical protein